LRCEDQTLTSFAGLVFCRKFFASIDLKSQLRRGFEPLARRKVFPPATVFLPLIVPLLLGFRELQDGRYYRDDPLVQRLLGLQRLPDVAMLSRTLKQATAQSVEALRRFLRQRVLDGLRTFRPTRVTLDFDGSVLSTQRRAEGTAVGMNYLAASCEVSKPEECRTTRSKLRGMNPNDSKHRPGGIAKAFGLDDATHCSSP
jgi:hypothetical protein